MTFTETCDAILGAKGIESGFIQRTERLRQYKVSAMSIAGAVVHGQKREGVVRLCLRTSDKFFEDEGTSLPQLTHKAFAYLGLPLPENL